MEIDARVQRTRTAIREALVSLVEEDGLGAVTHHRVAERSGLGRATIYRHCPTVEALVQEAVGCIDIALPPPDEPTFESQLVAIGRKFARDANDPAGAALLLGLMERAHHDLEARALQTAHINQMTDLLRVAAGDLAPRLDLELVVAQVLGPILFRSLVVGEPVDDAFVVEAARRALVGVL